MASSADRPSRGASVIDVLDRVLDKGIVIDAWVRVSFVGIDLLTVEARVLVASIETYLQHAQAVAQVNGFAAPPHLPMVSRPPKALAPAPIANGRGAARKPRGRPRL
jgi:hypothetical protein